MNKDDILKAVAPCSLCCYTCPAMKGGVIAESAKKLCYYFEGYYDFNKENLPIEYRGYTDRFFCGSSLLL